MDDGSKWMAKMSLMSKLSMPKLKIIILRFMCDKIWKDDFRDDYIKRYV